VADRARLQQGEAACAKELPDALYESGRSQVSMRVPKDGTEPLSRGVVRAADVLLAIMARGGLIRNLARPGLRVFR